MQPEFQPLVTAATTLCESALGDRLTAIYLHGSVAMGDAVAGISDLDCFLVTRGALTEADTRALAQLEARLLSEYPIASEIHLAAHSTDDLAADSFARFILKYNSTLILGRDVVRELDRISPTLEPNAATAKGRLPFARHCFSQALDGRQPDCTGPLPSDPYYVSRKFARYFVVIEGAYFLMSQNRFASFAGEDVLSKLADCGFAEELSLARAVLSDAKRAAVEPDDFLRRVRPLVDWMFDETDRA